MDPQLTRAKVLGEAQVVIALLFEALLVDETLVNVFDVCLLLCGIYNADICRQR
jgi:hypothetical protein